MEDIMLITTYYISSNENRNKEVQKCLIKNCDNKYIKKIYLLNDKIYNLSFLSKSYLNKIEQVIITTKENSNYILHYKDAFEFINKNLKNKTCILSNSDIYFDDTLSKITSKLINNNVYALLRYDEDEYGNKNIFMRHNEPRDDTQDCWIFKSPLKIDLSKINFSFRTLGCDSILAKHIYDTGIQISNPSLDIVTTHVHKTDYRTYNCDDRIHGVYCLLKPCHLNEYPNPTFMDY